MLDPVHQTVLQHLNPEHTELEIWRADALEVRHRHSPELDASWNSAGSKEHLRR